jgi:dihydrofolate synthase/folylpolyglutamate synthase
VDPCISVITDIDLDHQKFLGNTLKEIAGEKAGILRRGGVAVLLPQHPQVNDALGHALTEIEARPVSALKHMPPVTPGAGSYHVARPDAAGRNQFPLAFMENEIFVDSPLAGRHQLRNLALAITAAEQLNSFGFGILGKHVEEGTRLTRWPGRFQVIPRNGEIPEIVLDVAHNPAGAWALRAALSAFYDGSPLTFVFGAMRDKAIGEIADILFPLAERVVATQVLNPRAASTHEIAEAAARSGTVVLEEENVQAAIERAQELAGKNGVVVITGSIYIVGEALGVLAHGPARQSV